MPDEKPKRRPRYKGTHPKSFKEKYKEQNPERYTDDVAKVMEQGRTPAGMHRSIMVKEIMDFLQIKPGQKGLDATLGYGGHSHEILKLLTGDGGQGTRDGNATSKISRHASPAPRPASHLYAIDVDPLELPKTKERLAALGYGEEILSIRKLNFSGIDQVVAESGLLNFVLADLGVSSMQIDNPDRGFSFDPDRRAVDRRL